LDFTSFLTGFGPWGVLASVLIGVFFLVFWGTQRGDNPDRGRWVAWLKHDTFARRYRVALDAALNRLDRFLSPEFPDQPTRHGSNPKTERSRAWSWRLLDLCLLYAVVYPILAALVDWAVTGDAGRLGNLEVVAALPDWRSRWPPIAVMALAAMFGFLARAANSIRTRLLFLFVGVGLAVAGGTAFSFAVAVSAASTVLVAFLVLGVGKDALAGAGALGVACGVAIAVAGTPSVAGSIAGADALSFAFAIAVALTVALALTLAQNWIGRRLNARGRSLLAFSALLFAILALTVLLGSAGMIDFNRVILLFLGFLPLLNAWADFASIGLTRWRLRCGVQRHLVANAIVDAVAAIAILFGLAFAVIATAHLVRPPDGAPLIDLPALFDDLRGDGARQYWWLGFMLFSTLLPTLIHVAIGAFVSGWIGRPIAVGLMKGDSPEGRAASIALTLCAALAVWLPLFALWQGLTWFGPALLGVLLDACEWFRGMLDAAFPRGTG